MERLRIAAPVLFIAVGTCLLCLGVRSATGMHYETPVDLPRAVTGETIRGRDWIEIHLARDGALSMTLNELVRRTRERPKSAILVCADTRAPLLNAYYVFGVIGEVDRDRDVYLAVRDAASLGAIRVRLEFAISDVEIFDSIPEELGLLALPAEHASLRDRRSFLRRVREQRDRTAAARREADWTFDVPPSGTVHARSDTTVTDLVRALDALRLAGLDRCHVGWARPHPWVREQAQIAAVGVVELLSPIPLSNRFGASPVHLPLARNGVADRWDDEDDRIQVSVDASGLVEYRGRTPTLAELAGIAPGVVEGYHLKQRKRGLSGRIAHGGEEWSRVIVLLRIDKEAPWRAVAPVVAVLREARIFRLQFACLAEADLSYSVAEAERCGVVRRDRMPAPPGWADCKLAFELAAAPAASMISIRLDGTVAGPPATDPVEIRVDPGAAAKYVVAAVGDLVQAGATRVRFASLD